MAYETITNYSDPELRDQHQKNSRLTVDFYRKTEMILKAIMVDGVVTHHEEMPVESEFITIRIPGDDKTVIDEHVTDKYRHEFARQYYAWKNGQVYSGTPIEELTDIPADEIRKLKFSGFIYVEQLANSPDHIAMSIPGGTGFRIKAKAYIERGSISNADVIKAQQAQLETQQAQLENQQAQIEEMKDLITRFVEAKPHK